MFKVNCVLTACNRHIYKRDVRNKYILKFIMGQLDPSDDKAWNDYKASLEKVGLSQTTKIRAEAFGKIKW